MPNINLDDAYILGETGAQVDKVTGLFTKDEDTTSGEKAFAQLNIGTAGSNRNLLDNPWFTVNQRGFTSGTSGYISDRWTILGGTPTITALSPYGISVATSSAYNFIQNCWFTEADIDGRTLTLSTNIDGLIQSVTFTAAVNSYYSFNFNNGLDMFRIYTGSSATAHPQVRFTHNTGSATHNYTVYATKLELGSVSTLANDAPPDYYDELDHCKWYFERIKALSGNYAPMGFGYAASETAAIIFVPMHAKRGSGYTVATSGSFRLVNGQTTYSVTAISKYSSVPNNWLILTVTSSGMTAGQPLEFGARGDSAAYIDVNNDL